MSHPAAGSARRSFAGRAGEMARVAVIGAPLWLDGCAPAAPVHGVRFERLPLARAGDVERASDRLAALRPHLSLIFDPVSLPAEALAAAGGVTVGVLVDGLPDLACASVLEGLDRLVSFVPALTGAPIGRAALWRAIPPPISDTLFAEVGPPRDPPRAIAIGRSSAHREDMLMAAKHRHDLLQVIHGVIGEPLRELMRDCDVGVFVAREPDRASGAQVGMHLAAGQLLLAGPLAPAHGLELNIDYLHVDSPEGIVWVLDRLGRFPAMYQRIRVRGRLKAEQYRASKLLARLVHDALRDVAAFGRGPDGVAYGSARGLT